LTLPSVTAQQEAGDNSWSRKLHVIVLESGTKNDKPLEGPHEVAHLPGAELPEILSHALLPSLGGTLTMPAAAGIPNRATLLGIFTFSLSGDFPRQAEAEERTNEIAGLHYSLRLRNCSDDACDMELHSTCRRANSTVTVSVSRKASTIVHFNGSPRLSYASTFLNGSSLLSSGIASIKDPGVTEPKPIQTPRPGYPTELRDPFEERRFSFVGIMTEQGVFDRSRWIILECPHPYFARNALGTMIEKWTFVPGRKAEQAIRILATAEVTFSLRGPG
jgi:hypothetical protein